MRILTLMTYIFSMLITPFLHGAVYEIDSFNEISGELETMEPTDLIVFDVEYVLTTPVDMILRPGNEQIRARLFKTCFEGVDTQRQEFLYSQLLLQSKERLVELDVPGLIKSLQVKKKKVVAITPMAVGKMGAIANLEDFRINELKRFGLDFSSAFPGKAAIPLTLSSFPSRSPLFKKGVIFTDLLDKGAVLAMFIQKMGLKPKRVMMVDDKMEVLVSAQNELGLLNIEFTGFRYLAANYYENSLKEETAIFQIQYLIDQGKWLSDEEATRMLKEAEEKITLPDGTFSG